MLSKVQSNGGDLTGNDGRSNATITESVEQRELGLDEVFEILKNQRRRYVLKYLRETDGETTLSTLAEQIAAWENDKEIRQITSSERKRVYVGLYQCHLPKMDDMHIISFNKPRAIVEPADNIDLLYPYIDTDRHPTDRSWSTYYASLSGASILALVGAFVVESAITIPAVVGVTAATIIAFAGTALIHARTERTDAGENAGQSKNRPVDSAVADATGEQHN